MRNVNTPFEDKIYSMIDLIESGDLPGYFTTSGVFIHTESYWIGERATEEPVFVDEEDMSDIVSEMMPDIFQRTDIRDSGALNMERHSSHVAENVGWDYDPITKCERDVYVDLALGRMEARRRITLYENLSKRPNKFQGIDSF